MDTINIHTYIHWWLLEAFYLGNKVNFQLYNFLQAKLEEPPSPLIPLTRKKYLFLILGMMASIENFRRFSDNAHNDEGSKYIILCCFKFSYQYYFIFIRGNLGLFCDHE